MRSSGCLQLFGSYHSLQFNIQNYMSAYSTTNLSLTARFIKALPAVPLHRAVRNSHSSAGKVVLPLSVSDALEEENDFTGETICKEL